MIDGRAIVAAVLTTAAAFAVSSCGSKPSTSPPVSTPAVLSVVPDQASNTDTASIVVTGTGFETGAAALIGAYSLTDLVLVSGEEIRGVVPKGIIPGVYGVRVRNRDGGLGTLSSAFLVTGPGMVHSGVISEDEVWAARDSPHVVGGELAVRGSRRPTLTIEPGSTVLFQSGARITAGDGAPGRLVASGTDVAEITFSTSLPAGFEQRGAWGSIALAGDSCAVFRHCSFAWGGGATLGGLDPCLVLLRMGSAVIEDCTFEESQAEGLHVDDDASLLSFARCTFRRCTGPLISLRIEQTVALAPDDAFEAGEILVREGDVPADLSWPGFDARYRVGFDLSANGRLTLGAGASLAFAAGTGLDSGVDSEGGLGAVGTSDRPVMLDSDGIPPSPGSWRGVHVGPRLLAGSRLVHVQIRNAGGSGQAAALECDGAAPIIQDCEIEASGSMGLVFRSGARPVSFSRNVITGCLSYALEVPAAGVGGISASNGFAGNGMTGILVDGGVVSESALWSVFLSTPYVIHGEVEVRGASGPTLTIAPGATLRFDAASALIVGADAADGGAGALVADAGGVPTLFTSVVRGGIPQQPGDWTGLVFLGTTVDAASRVSGCVVEYGGAGALGDILCRDASPSLAGLLVQWSAGYGLYLEGSAAPDTSAIIYQLNALGDVGP